MTLGNRLMKVQYSLTLTILSIFSVNCMAGSATEAPDALTADDVPTQVSKSSTGDFFVDPATELGWSTRVSVGLDYSEAHSYCWSLGKGWRLPTVGELETMTTMTGQQRSMRPEFKKGLPDDGVLFSGEEIPVIDDNKQPWVMRISDGHSFNGQGHEGYVRCAHGPVTRGKTPYREPAAKLLGERWWEEDKACPLGSMARGTPGLTIACKDKLGKDNGRHTSWADGRRTEAHYRAGKLHGKLTRSRTKTAGSEVQNYRNGQLHGTSSFWHDSGKKASETEYSTGVLHGWQQNWNDKGQLQLRRRYQKGRIVEQLYYDLAKPRNGSAKQKHANGVDSYVGTFKKGRALGQHYGYYENGRMRFKRNYNAKGLPHGSSADWHPNGHPHEVSTYNNGALQGEQVIFAEDGTVLSRTKYNKGLVVE